MTTTSFDEIFARARFMVILRGLSPDQTVELSLKAWELGIDSVEVPIGLGHHVESLAAAVKAGAERGKRVGAGTVVSETHVEQAAEVGAAYTVAPGFDADVLAASNAADLPHLPGVATATEVQQAVRYGCQWVKVFPASVLGPDWFRAIAGPFPGVKTVATGGIHASQAGDFHAAGVNVVGLGSALSDPAQFAALARMMAH
ncbi:bifunctional 4-hydroxy-2-oxoglutarate aldolase/2-dehydro-3-deoxy-phosphogluconate aldolase [Natronoglycomyces albus]|uniref:Bifunctional 4-hydroxy-2-oxoglutarate aldolase/2-dehydro-3-deoxy-phosphogluconate aldolase n=1 Tax=Natronoglycomyces albus TaxID=2811108 RepID=A0A895XGP1_9ACTN|nr:bifunctional 4-hydroxy-2-oxoglutarate aldolase/2-dehydro-3-deoxy-phosphogluconate aldolase [Natronoglycomyces albus]QSB04057.1 bifunctional 4-hydroxy-2-oxoglutarate aldolase/2-dehydro-3-deoxy-phosphogluconate aldolase [Natronoglycomyces albus]